MLSADLGALAAVILFTATGQQQEQIVLQGTRIVASLENAVIGNGNGARFLADDDDDSVALLADANGRAMSRSQLLGKVRALGGRQDASRRADLTVTNDNGTVVQRGAIEEQIAETVKKYQQYETDIFTEVASDSAITLVALYPELKADTLVQSQIDVYIKNNEKIKSLKEDKINGTINKWWLYFGS